MSATTDLAIESAWRRFRPAAEGSDTLSAFCAFAESLNLARDTVQLAVEIASFEVELGSAEREALVVLVLVALAALEDGNTRFPVGGSEGRNALAAMLRPLGETPLGIEAPGRFTAAIERLLQDNLAARTITRDENDYKPLIYIEPFIYLRKLRVAERELAAQLASMLAAAPLPAFSLNECTRVAADICAIPIATQSGLVTLSAEQRDAVAASTFSRFTLISGGPGTGKTSIVIAILRLMTSLGIDPGAIALAAPTGKAANRIGDCIARALNSSGNDNPIDIPLRHASLEPATLHRLLGYSAASHRFRHHRNNPIAAKVVIVDEGSMLDLALMERLVGAIPAGARLVILGDADQLPSVAAGAVFKELIPHASTPGASVLDRSCFRLRRNYRMSSTDPAGSSILAVANRINAGEANIVSGSPGDVFHARRRSSAAELMLGGVEFLESKGRSSTELLDRWYDERIRGDEEIIELKQRVYVEGSDGFDADDASRLRRLFAFAAASRILTVTRVFETGADRINQRMHRRARGDTNSGYSRLVGGEPVIAIRNDYERMLFNGDNGIVLRVRRRDSGAWALMAVFPRRENFVAYRMDIMRETLELAYAMTVHKAQGSEFDSIALILPDKKIPLLTREVLYTAVSRARRAVAIVGSENVLAEAIAAPAARYSGLRELLAGNQLS